MKKTIISLAIIFIFLAGPQAGTPANAELTDQKSAYLGIIPDYYSMMEGREFEVSFTGQSPELMLNTAKISLAYPSESLKIKKIDYTGTACNLVVYEKTDYPNSLELACGTTTGDLGRSFKIASVTFEKTSSAGWYDLSLSDSMFYKNDGLGTPVVPVTEHLRVYVGL